MGNTGFEEVVTTQVAQTPETIQEQGVQAVEQDVQEQGAQVAEQEQAVEQDVNTVPEQLPVSTAISKAKRQKRVGVKKRDCVKQRDSVKQRDYAKQPKYVGSYTEDGLLNTVYQVHEVIGDVYVLEAISYFDLLYFVSGGYEPSSKPVAKMIRELKLSEIEKPRLFYSWLGIASEFIRAAEEWDRRYRKEETNKG